MLKKGISTVYCTLNYKFVGGSVFYYTHGTLKNINTPIRYWPAEIRRLAESSALAPVHCPFRDRNLIFQQRILERL